MLKRRIGGLGMFVLGSLCLLSTGCVDTFGGSVMDMDFQPAVEAPADQGVTPPDIRTPPHNTFFTFWAVQYIYQTDADGNVVTDMDGNPVIDQSFAHQMQIVRGNDIEPAPGFEIKSLINQSSPCFIDTEQDRFPGIHSTMELDRIVAETGITDPIGDTSAPMKDRILVLTAKDRHDLLPALEGTVKAVVSYSTAQPPGDDPDFQVGSSCIEDGGDPTLIPPISCTGDESNAVRLRLCEAYWTAHPSYYEGNDKVYTIPRNGKWYGAVNGTNPKNGAPYLGGAAMFTTSALHANEVDALLLNWQYKDLDGDGEPDYPTGTPDAEKSPMGFHYMAGEPQVKTRGVVNFDLRNRNLSTLKADVAVIPQLGEDDVQF